MLYSKFYFHDCDSIIRFLTPCEVSLKKIPLILLSVCVQTNRTTNTPARLIYGTVCGPNPGSDSLHLHECPAVPIRRERFSPRLSDFILLVSTAFPLSLRAYLTGAPTRNTAFNACNDATMNSVCVSLHSLRRCSHKYLR